MAKRSSFADAVLGRAVNSSQGFKPWFQKCPPDVQEELEQLRASWAAGETGLQKRAMARAVVAEMTERGHPVSGVQGVEAWLEQAGKR